MTLVYAHRGSSGTYPENTALAFRAAVAAGVEGIVLDVHATADGVPVVIHDRGVERTTDGRGLVDELTLARVQKLDAGLGERVPTLVEVLELVGDAVHFDIEIKGRGIEQTVLDLLHRYPRAGWAISSFDWNTLREVRRRDARAEVWPLAAEASDKLVAIATELGSPVVALAAGSFTATTATRLRQAGLEAMLWTVNAAADARRLRSLGAYALCTDFPERIIAALRSA